MKNLYLKLNKYGIAAFCYFLYFTTWLFLAVALCIFDSFYLNAKNGNIALEVADFELVNLIENPDGTLTSDGTDPQLIYKSNVLVRNISYSINGLTTKAEALAFYGKSFDDDFSVKSRIWPIVQKNGSLLYVLPHQKVFHIRIDPTTLSGETFTLSNIILNGNRPFYAAFVPSLSQLFCAIIIPGLFASLIVFLKKIALIVFKRGVAK